jgi:hypothetical protein
MGFNGFDIPKIRTLAGDLGKLGDGAGGLHADVAGVLTQANALMGGKPATTSPLLEPLVGQIVTWPFGPRSLPGSLNQELNDMSGSMKRRCTQLEGANKLVDKGYQIDPTLAFSDETAPDEKKITDALKYFDDHIDDSGGFLWSNPAQGAQEVLDKFKTLSPAELDAVINRMTPQQLKQLNDQLGEGSSWWGGGDPNNDVKMQYANLLLSEVGPATLAKIEKQVPNLEPDLHTQYTKNLTYQAKFGPLFGANGVDIKHDLSQGQDGDCWFLSSLGAIAERDPGFFQQHIRENPNGTYTVTFYRSEGFPPQTVPVEVTVDNQLPSDASGNPAYAQTPDNVMWVAIYEKAYAQFKGGYGNIDGGWGDVGLHDLTGQPTDRLNAGDLSLNDINEKIKQGDAITTGSKDDNFLWWSGDEYVDGGKIVTSHEYSIERVDMNAHPPTITLLNPWGTNGAAPQEITLTEDEWHKYYNEVGITKTKV